METIAIIPARGGSKGLKNKNILELNGVPLITYTIKAALACPFINRVIVSTDSEDIAAISKESGAEVPFIRPRELATDTTPSIDVLIHAVEAIEDDKKVDNVILLQPTSPLRTSENIKEAYELYQDAKIPVVSVCPAETHPHLLKVISNGLLTNYEDKEPLATRRQDFSEVFQLNGAIYITTRDMVVKQKVIYDNVAIPYIMDKVHSIDIDDKIDFLLAEIILKNGDVY